MKCDQLLGAIAVAAMACCMPVTAQENGPWRASSSNAQAITGDVAFSSDRIAINFSSYPIAQIRGLKPDEAFAVFEGEPGGSGGLYRVSIPGAKRFLHKNTLCGNEDVQWLATYVAGHFLHVAFFSGSNMPVLTPEAISNSTDLCGPFTYAR